MSSTSLPLLKCRVEYAQDVQDAMKNIKIRGKNITIEPAIKSK